MIIRIKESMWRLVVLLCALLPVVVRRVLCRLIFDVEATGRQPEGLKNLFVLDDILRSQIDCAAINHGGGVHPKLRLIEYHKFFVDRIKPGEKVLDVGCGFGGLANDLAAVAWHVTGVDLNVERIEAARRKYSGGNISFVHGDILSVNLEGPFDIITISNVLEHVSDRVKLLEDLEKRFHPRCFLIRVPMLNRHWSVSMRAELGLPCFLDPTHYTEYTEESFRKEMKDAGLTITHMSVIWGEIWAEAEAVSVFAYPV